MKSEKISWVGVAVLSLVVGCGLTWLLNRGYGETSEQGYAYSIALFSACNQQDTTKLDQIAEMIEQDLEDGKVGIREGKWLNAIIDKGMQGDWDTANRRIRRLMNDQVREVQP